MRQVAGFYEVNNFNEQRSQLLTEGKKKEN